MTDHSIKYKTIIFLNRESDKSSELLDAKDLSEEFKTMIDELKKASEKGTDLRHINRLLKETFEYRRQIIKNMNSCADVITDYPFLMKCDVVSIFLSLSAKYLLLCLISISINALN